jgi:hypothetical protein
MHYLSCFGEIDTDCTKKHVGQITLNLCFCIRCDLRVMFCIRVHLGCEMSKHNCSRSGGTGTKCTNNAQGHVTPNLCFCIRWDLLVT